MTVREGLLAVGFHRELPLGHPLDVLLDVRLAAPVVVMQVDILCHGDFFHLFRDTGAYVCIVCGDITGSGTWEGENVSGRGEMWPTQLTRVTATTPLHEKKQKQSVLMRVWGVSSHVSSNYFRAYAANVCARPLLQLVERSSESNKNI